MKHLGLWKIENGHPQRLISSQITLEKDLEDWIEKDPTLLRQDFIIVGRQIKLDSGRLDLLAIDAVGRLIIIEIKRGNLNRDTVSQAIDYAACIDEMQDADLHKRIIDYLSRNNPHTLETVKQLLENSISDRREVIIYIVGTEQDPNLERIVRYLNAQVIAVTFNTFVNSLNEPILVRELTELDTEPRNSISNSNAPNFEELLSLATANGVGRAFKILYEVATEIGLYPRYYRKSIMYTPPNKRNRMLFTTWVHRWKDGMESYIGIEPFAEFYPVNETQVSKYLGEEGYRSLSDEGAEELANGLRQLFESITEQNRED